ncbi:MAG TPA: signal peptidase I [Candidatus Limnocylindria bacterium]|jgi:signal peptidase|nr:signal peptidase I [Candidatus Limnocylindria bacterium]
MNLTVVTIARRSLTLGWLLLVAGLIGLAAVTHMATTFVIQGSSMQPAIPFGSLIVVAPASPDAVRVGDVVTIRADNGAVVSHRVTRRVDLGSERMYEVKGDANPTPDPVLIPERSVIGRVALTLPYAGFVAAMLGTPSGVVSLLATVATGLLLILLVEQLEGELSEHDGTAGAAAPEGPPRGALA